MSVSSMDSVMLETPQIQQELDPLETRFDLTVDCKINLMRPRYRNRCHLNKYQSLFILWLIIFIEFTILWMMQSVNHVWILIVLVVANIASLAAAIYLGRPKATTESLI